ncbi:hypothetical protein [Nannocystis bainbridge]|uniref:Uncharacterized protein n=1 Tax=Nannocystis bainbridge TaxID=2995303 RepID=A0ABT5DZY3_9BACT|nr:hypothetical protein [Nannocystis bainbridge]MDC0719185.1 hypothetical protein [Nannocystis bainbridge]
MTRWVDTIDKREVPRQTAGRLTWSDLDDLRTPGRALSEDLVAYAVEDFLGVKQDRVTWVRPILPVPDGALDVDDHAAPRLTCRVLCHGHYSLLVLDRHTGELLHLDTANRNHNNAQAEALVGGGGRITHAAWVPKQQSGSNNCGPMVALMLAAIAGTDGAPANVRRAITGGVSNDAAERLRRALLDHFKPMFVEDDEDDDGALEDEARGEAPRESSGEPPPVLLDEAPGEIVDDVAEEDEPGEPPPVLLDDAPDEIVDDVAEEDEPGEPVAEEIDVVVARAPWLPPAIDYAGFVDLRPVPPVPESSNVHDVPRSEHAAEVRSTHARSRLQLEALYLEDADGQRSRAYRYPADVDHAAPAEDQRFAFRVDDPAPQSIRWRIRHAKPLRRGVLELFVAGRAEPVWSRALSAEELRTSPGGERSDGSTVEGGLAWTGSFAGGAPADGRVRAGESPYKLKLTIFSKTGAVVAKRQAWTYFDVPYQHKYALLSYVPSTEFGCFGVRFDPARARLDVFIDAMFAFLPVTPVEAAWDPGRKAEIVANYPRRIHADWSGHYDLSCDGVRAAPVIVLSGRHVQDLPAMEGTDNPLSVEPALVRRMDRDSLHFFAWFRDGIGRSGLMLHPLSASVNLFAPSAFDEDQASMMLSSPTIREDLQRAQRSVLEALREDAGFAATGARIEVLDEGRPDARPRIVLPFASRVEELDPATHRVALDRLVTVLNAIRGELNTDVPVFVTGCMKRSERSKLLRRQHHDRERAAHVSAYLRREGGLAAPAYPEGATARQMVAGRGYVVQAKDGQIREQGGVEIEIGYTDDAEYSQVMVGRTAYCALVHEFGHMLGIPDEYMTYEFDTSTCSIASSQPRLREMCLDKGIAAPEFPREGANLFHAALMSAGVRFYERYYLTIAEAVEKATTLAMGAPRRWDIGANETVAEATDEAFHQRYDHFGLIEALHRARRAVQRHEVAPVRLLASIRRKILRTVAGARIAYLRVVSRDTLAPVHRVGPVRVLIGVGVFDGDEVLHASIHARQWPLTCTIALPLGTQVVEGVHLPATGDGRVPVTLRSRWAFEGTGVFTCSTLRVRFFATADGDAPLDVFAGHTLRGRDLGSAEGVVLYMEGEPQGAELGLQLRSDTHLLSPDVARVELGSTRAALDVYAPVHEPPAVPQPLSAADRLAPGAVVLLDHEDARRPRTLVTVHRPHGATRRLRLRLRGGKVDLFAAERATPGEAKLGAERRRGDDVAWEYVIPDERFDARGRASFWLAGAAVSGAARDASVELRWEGKQLELASARLTVVDVTLTATVPATRARTERTVSLRPVTVGANQLLIARDGERRRATTDDQVFDAARMGASRLAKIRATHPYATTDFDKNPPLVLIRGSLGDSQVRVDLAIAPAELAPAVAWDIARAADDTIDEAPPVLNPGGLRCTFGDGATGSFHVRALLGGRPLAVLNLVMVAATLQPDGDGEDERSRAGVEIARPHEIDGDSIDNAMAREFGQPQIVRIKSGDFGAQPCVRLRGKVRLISGGPRGRRGLDQVAAGWVQNLTHVLVRSRYEGGRQIELGHVHNKEGASILRPFMPGADAGDSYFVGADVAIALEQDVGVDTPILDTGLMGQGGADSVLGNSKFEEVWNAHGLELRVEALDAPATEFFVHYPGQPEALLTRIRYEHDFRAYLCVWTNCIGAAASNKTEFRAASYAADRCVAVLRRVDWSLKGRWRVRWEGLVEGEIAGPGWATKIRIEPLAPEDELRAVLDATIDEARPARDAGVELYYPTELQVFAWQGSE